MNSPKELGWAHPLLLYPAGEGHYISACRQALPGRAPWCRRNWSSLPWMARALNSRLDGQGIEVYPGWPRRNVLLQNYQSEFALLQGAWLHSNVCLSSLACVQLGRDCLPVSRWQRQCVCVGHKPALSWVQKSWGCCASAHMWFLRPCTYVSM